MTAGPLRILLVSHFFPPSHTAGTENYTLGIALALGRRGHDVRVVCARTWDQGPAYWNGVSHDVVHGLPVERVALNWAKADDPNHVLYESALTERWFEEVLDRTRPDIVHVTSTATLGIGVLRAAHRRGIRLVLTLMDFWFLCPRTILTTGEGQLCDGRTTAWDCERCLLTSSRFFQRLHPYVPQGIERRLWTQVARQPHLSRIRGARGWALDVDDRKAVMRQALEWPDVILSHSRFVKTMFERSGLCEQGHRIRHLPNGHDLGWRDTYRGKSASSTIRFAYMGQIVESKGIQVLVEAFQVADQERRCRLDIWGDTARDAEYADRLRAACAGASDRIALRGCFRREDLADVLREIDVLVVPSMWYENAPLVIQEAFAAATPVIATDLGGMREAVSDGLNGLLFERGDAGSLAGQLRRIIVEPELLATLRSGVPRVASVDEEAVQLDAIYRDSKAAGGDEDAKEVVLAARGAGA